MNDLSRRSTSDVRRAVCPCNDASTNRREAAASGLVGCGRALSSMAERRPAWLLRRPKTKNCPLVAGRSSMIGACRAWIVLSWYRAARRAAVSAFMPYGAASSQDPPRRTKASYIVVVRGVAAGSSAASAWDEALSWCLSRSVLQFGIQV